MSNTTVHSNIIETFLAATSAIFLQVGNVVLNRESLEMTEVNIKLDSSVAAIIGITGSLKGQVLLLIEEPMAFKISSAILMGMPVTQFDEVAESGVCEMANMIAGEGVRLLHEIGLGCELSVPSLVRGQAMAISFHPKNAVAVAKFSSEWGPLTLILRFEVPANH